MMIMIIIFYYHGDGVSDRSDTVTGCLSVSFYRELPGHQHTLADWTEEKETTNILREDYIYISLHRCEVQSSRTK